MNNSEYIPESRRGLTTEYERGFNYDVHVDMTMCGAGGCVTPSGWQRLIVGLIERHLENIGMGEQELLDRLGMSWILLSTHVRPKRGVKLGEHLTGVTWNSGVMPPVFRRDLRLFGEDGRLVASGATYSTLFSASERKFCTDRAVIGSLWLPEGEKVIDAQRRAPRLDGFVPVEERRARPSMTDGMGHVNNTRYGEFVYDALTDSERADIGSLSAMDVWFFTEMREGCVFSVERAPAPGGTAVRGVLPGGGVSFLMCLGFGQA